MDTCKRMWSENQIGEIAKENSITGIEVAYFSEKDYGPVGLGTYKSMQYPEGYYQPLDDGETFIVPRPKLKNILGNQSLFGSGSIDLYKHHVTLSMENRRFYIDIISSNDLYIESLIDLKSILGDTFQIPCYGFFDSGETRYYAQYADENAIYYANSTNSFSWSDFTITDNITTI